MNILSWIVVVSSVFRLSLGNLISAHCGKKSAVGLIRSDSEASNNDWPWLAALISKSEDPDKNGNVFCTATLVSLKCVITSAHCMHEKNESKERLNASDLEVHLGRNNLSDNEELNEMAKILEPIVIIAIHPNWTLDNSDGRKDADIALIIAGKEVETSKFILPICLPDPDYMSNVIGTLIGTTVGWGLTDERTKAEDIPKQAQVVKVDGKECEDLSEYSRKRTFCVKGIEEGSRLCAGSGFYTTHEDVWSIEGIFPAALLNSNCQMSKHSLFTEIRPFMNWIKRGINEFYEAQFTYSFKKDVWFTEPYHVLETSEASMRGAFLTMVGHPVDLGVKFLRCEDQDWEYLPNNIGYLFPNLEKLHAIYSIKFIERSNFKNMGKLRILDLRNNQIEQIPSDCFDDLKVLATIYIHDNKLKTIHANTFLHNSFLVEIDLRSNQIQPTELKNLKNKNVEVLTLENNLLESIPFDAFNQLANLKNIFLGGNKLTTLHQDTFLNNLNLTGLYASNNQIQILPEGLFRNNRNLKHVYFRFNKITEINTTFQSHGIYDFNGNICINQEFNPSNESLLNQMNAEIRSLCGKK